MGRVASVRRRDDLIVWYDELLEARRALSGGGYRDGVAVVAARIC